jgi:hypothetical protein
MRNKLFGYFSTGKKDKAGKKGTGVRWWPVLKKRYAWRSHR